MDAPTVAARRLQAASIAGMDDPIVAWAASGAMALTGRPDRPPLGPPAPLVDRLMPIGRQLNVDALQLLGERAALQGLTRHGHTSCGGTTRLVRAADGWIAASLAREQDVDAIPAWLDLDRISTDPWTDVVAVAARTSVEKLEQRGVLLGLAVAALSVAALSTPEPVRDRLPVRLTPYGAAARNRRQPMVVDLSSLWAGPLCGQLLHLNGARVVKVESEDRPDGARSGSPEFFDLLNGGKQSVVLDFRANDGRDALRRLLTTADVVIEASRPRALEQLGVIADELMRHENGPQVWISITGHGRVGDAAQRVAFGDDAAVAGGLVVYDDLGPSFCADAIADPLTGMVAAAAALEARRDGRRCLIDVSMANVAASFAGPTLDANGPAAQAPSARPRKQKAAPLGRDTRAVLEAFATT